MTIDTTNMCSHLQRKLFAPDGEYRAIREQIENDPTLTAVVRSRQLHIYRDGKKILVLAGKSAPKIIRGTFLSGGYRDRTRPQTIVPSCLYVCRHRHQFSHFLMGGRTM